MPLTDYTFRLGDTGVVLNDDSVSLPFVDITRVIGLDSPPFRETQREREGTDGGTMDAEFESGRDVILEGTIYCNVTTVEPFLDALKANYAPSSTLVPLYLKGSGVAERLVFVKPRGVRYDWSQSLRNGTVIAQFLMYAEDPRLYDTTLLEALLPSGATIVSGFAFSLGFPFGFSGVTDTTDGQYITNGGNRPAPAELIMQGPALNPVVINDTVSKTLKFNINLGATDVLRVDLANKTVRLNGTTNRRNVLQAPNWFLLEPGNNFIRYRTESPYAITVANDAFTRTVSPGWQVTPTGDTWQHLPADTDFSTNGTQGQMSIGTANVDRIAHLPDSTIDTEILYSFTVPVLAAGASIEVYTDMRWASASNFLQLGISIQASDQSLQSVMFKTVGGSFNFIAGSSFATVPGITHTAGSKYYVRTRIIGSAIMYKIWKDPASEPINWTFTYNDGSLVSTGLTGMRAKVGSAWSGSLPLVISFDDVTVVNLRGGSSMILRYRHAWR